MSDKLNLEFLDFSNFRDHPEVHNVIVFHYYEKPRADYFVELLESESLWYESHIENGPKTIYFIATRRSDDTRTKHLNNLVIGKFRKRFIPDRGLRWVVFIISALIVFLIIMGIIKSG